VITQGRDYSVGILTGDGRLVAHGTVDITPHMGTFEFSVAAIMEDFDTLEPGNVYIVNDPHRAGTHTLDVRFVRPEDFEDEIVAGVGTTNIPVGITEAVLRNGFQGMLAGTMVLEDGNITIDSADDAKGGVFASEGVLLIQGLSPYALSEERPSKGGGGTSIYLYDEYAWAIRLQAWVKELYSDAATPTS
ncbi:hypothetical protein LCGC14_3144230, partial [marine sediment metagenome]